MIRQYYMVVACLQYCTLAPICAVPTNTTGKSLECPYERLELSYVEVCKPDVSTNLIQKLSDKCLCVSECSAAVSISQQAADTDRIYESDRSTCRDLTTNIYSFSFANYVTNMYKIVEICRNMIPCSQFISATWGSMYPVYSNITDTIYLNQKCAVCNDDAQVLKWEVEVNCPMLHTYITEGFTRAMEGKLQEGIGCSFRFLPPPHVDLYHKFCFSFHRKALNSRSPAVTKEFNRLFSGNYTAYLYSGEMPTHVLNCFLCSDVRKSISDTMCNLRSDNRKPFVPLSFLLNGDSVDILTIQLKPYQRKRTGECDIDEIHERQTGLCRPFRCPDGQIQIERKCQYISLEWTAGPFLSFIKLEPYGKYDRFAKKNIVDLVLYKGRFFKYNLKSWERRLYYHERRNETYIRYFVLIVKHKRGTIRPDVFFKNFNTSLNSLWVLNIAGRKYRHKASIHTSFFYSINNGSDLMPDIAIHFPAYENEYYLKAVKPGSFEHAFRHIMLTTFFLCKQVYLRPSEFVDFEKWLYLNITDRVVEEVEFRRFVDVDGNETISVCMSTLGNDFWQVSDGVSDLRNELYVRFKLFVSLAVIILEMIDFSRN